MAMNDLRAVIEKHAHADCVAPPQSADWKTRRDLFTSIYRTDSNAGYTFPDRFKTLERELERCYCAGAFVACIMLSKALAEAVDAQFGNNATDRANFWTSISGQVSQVDKNWLANLRNTWAHAAKDPKYQLAQYANYVNKQSEIENDAVTAMRIAFRIGCEYAK